MNDQPDQELIATVSDMPGGELIAGVSRLLHEAAETHHRVYRITDGEDPDWATWYSEWLTRLSELPSLLGVDMVRSDLTYQLVRLDREYQAAQPGQRWEDYYAAELVNVWGATRPSA